MSFLTKLHHNKYFQELEAFHALFFVFEVFIVIAGAGAALGAIAALIVQRIRGQSA